MQVRCLRNRIRSLIVRQWKNGTRPETESVYIFEFELVMPYYKEEGSIWNLGRYENGYVWYSFSF